MLSIVLLAYGIATAVSAVVVFFASRRIEDQRRPATHRISLSLLAGLCWPLLLLGLIEFSSVMVYAKAHGHVESPSTARRVPVYRTSGSHAHLVR